MSLRTKKNRVSRFGTLEKYVVNGIDSTQYLSTILIQKSTNDTFDFNVRYAFFSKSRTAGGYLLQTGAANGSWFFSPDKEALIISVGYYDDLEYKNIFISTKTIEWEILKLTSKEMHLKTHLNNNTYELYFVSH